VDQVRWLTEVQVEEMTGIPRKTLQWWRYSGKGIRYTRIGNGRVRYRVDEVVRYMEKGNVNVRESG